ncbi:hypothetical protein SADUNF_Sadunf01G0065300 [Salix dunnii]|uniref:Protein yippee-like n=1 Tax=Salix dunnii TaxID=1413687 RepID=A0A835NAE6_9ROSI|nr:hypothetical protein SADUNF_Sadunf01G0065300 [Salix dunnii]
MIHFNRALEFPLSPSLSYLTGLHFCFTLGSSLVFLGDELVGVILYLSMAEVVGPRLYSCCNCRNHVAHHDDVISKAFQGRHGRAFLFSHAMNVMVGPKEDRQLMTGLHTVADVYCSDCRVVLGWKYERAYEETQKYKEGKFVLEKSKIVKENW